MWTSRWWMLDIKTSSWRYSFFDESFITLSPKESIEHIFQDFIRCDSTANNFSKEKEIFTDRQVFGSQERLALSSSCIRLRLICNLKFFSKENESAHFPVMGMKFINKFINPYNIYESIKLINSKVCAVVWLNQLSKLSLKYMYIYMGKSKL